ncbi:MAG: hypothetical protein ACTHZ5_15530 [Micrococcaceae bacterium]
MRSRNIRETRSVPAVLLLAGTALGATLITACSDQTPEPVMNEYQVFTQESSDTDVENLERVRNLVDDLDENTLRQVGTDGDTRFYTALSTPDDDEAEGETLCFIIDHGGDDAAAASCPSTADLEAPVVWLWSQSTQGSVEAYLVPDQQGLDLPEGWRQIGPNVLVLEDSEDTAETATILRNSEKIELHRGGKS